MLKLSTYLKTLANQSLPNVTKAQQQHPPAGQWWGFQIAGTFSWFF